MTARRPPPIYRKLRGVHIADEDGMRELAKRMREPDKLGRLLDQWAGALRAYLEKNGARLLERVPDNYVPGCTCEAIDRGVALYRTGDVPPGVPEAVEALYQIREVRQAAGEARVLAAVYLGAAIERARATEAFAGAIDSHRRSTRYLRNRQSVTDDQIRAAFDKYPRQKDAAAALGIEPRMLRNHEKRLGLKKRQSARLPPLKK